MNRIWINRVFKIGTWFAVLLCGMLLFFLFGVIIKNGITAIDLDFITSPSKKFGAEGGILYQILGSVLIIATAAMISFPIAMGAAIYKSEYIKTERSRRISNILIYGLNSIPSVVYGIFGLIFFVNFLGTGISWFVGSIILAIMIIPTITLSAYQSINSVPTIYRESALALGKSRWQVICHVLIPQGFSGFLTGLLIGMARAIGETAPIMFIATSFSGVELPGSLFESVSTLPTHILALAQQATNPQALENAWGASFILITIVMFFSLVALYIRTRYSNHMTR